MHTPKNQWPVLAAFPTRIGFGYTLHYSATDLHDWGIKWTTGDEKNKMALRKFVSLINFFEPKTLILEDIPDEVRKNRPRTAELISAMASIAVIQDIRVQLYSREQIKEAFASLGASTKQQIAEKVGEYLPDLKDLTPPPRKLWDPEPNAMSFFSAASLALAHFHFAKQSRSRKSVRK